MTSSTRRHRDDLLFEFKLKEFTHTFFQLETRFCFYDRSIYGSLRNFRIAWLLTHVDHTLPWRVVCANILRQKIQNMTWISWMREDAVSVSVRISRFLDQRAESLKHHVHQSMCRRFSGSAGLRPQAYIYSETADPKVECDITNIYTLLLNTPKSVWRSKQSEVQSLTL